LFPVYNVGLSGNLSPLPGSVSGYYVARVRIIDQSQNQSNPSDPNAQLPFVVDNTAPTAAFSTPTTNQVITTLNASGQITFTFITNKNIDLTHFNASSISVINAGPDGILGTADDVKVPINPASITAPVLLDAGIGGKGREEFSFSTEGTLTNNLYEVTLLNTGTDAVRDIAGNLLASPVSEQFVVDVPSLAKNLFVEAGFPTSTTIPEGTVENPYPTISAAMTAALPGDVVAVLPGVYTEQVTLKQFVRLLSASPSSTDQTVFLTSTGDALATIIRAPATTSLAAAYPTVTAAGLQSFSGLATEIAGFTIASPLVGDPASGAINPLSIGVDVTNSNVVIDKDYVADAGTGILVTTAGSTAITPKIDDDVIIGNVDGVEITDGGGTTSATSPVSVINNDFVFNTIGLFLNNLATSPMQAYVASNIFWQNHDQTNARNGFAIFSVLPNSVSLRNNLFSGNGASDTSQANATNDLGNGFSPTLLGATPDSLGNFVGNPAFVFPIDPRPGSDGPADLFVDADYQLTSVSAAIDNAWEPTAIPTDLLGNSRDFAIPGVGFGLPGFGPRDVGAFEFDGTGGDPIGGSFRVVTTSLEPIAGATFANGATFNTSASPTSVTVTFSGNVNPSTISPTDLVLSGSAVDSVDPPSATSLTWIDAYTVQFNLTGQFNSGGTLDISVAPNTIQSTTGSRNVGYSDNVVLKINPISPPVTNPTQPPPSHPVSPVTPVVPPTAVTPPPAPAPKGPLHAKKGHAPAKHPKHVVVKPVKHHVVVKPVKHHAVVKHVKEPVVVPKPVHHAIVAKKHKKA
jgi:large repetitive protein